MLNHIKSATNTIHWLLLFFVVLWHLPAHAQYEKKLTGFPEDNISAISETYDNAVLLLVDNSTERYKRPCFVIKFSLEGKELWRKKFINLSEMTDVIATKDSGFAVAGYVNMYPATPFTDTTGYSALLKFDKCGKLQWGRYVPVAGSIDYNVIEGNKGEFFLCAAAINGWDNTFRKPITILKFDKKGELLKYASFEGFLSKIYNSFYENEIYIHQNIYLPFQDDSSTYYSLTGLKKINYELETVAKTVIGFKEKQLCGTGPLIIRENTVISILTAFFTNGKPDCIMFSAMDTALNQKQALVYDAPGYYIGPAYAAKYKDTIITSGAAYSRTLDSAHTSLRIYNNSLELLKEVKINKNWTQIPNRIVQLKIGNILQNIANFSRTTGIGGPFTCSMYMYDRNLNPVAWPTVAPTKGYDWACSSSIPTTETIYVDSIVTPVHVEIDTTKPDWEWLYALSVREAERETVGKKSGNWLVYPQPLQSGDALYLQSLQASMVGIQNLKVYIYDLRGLLIQSTNAYLQSNNTWVINNLQLYASSLYLATLVNPQTGEIIGKIKITKQ